jgi:hypothetical protein
MELSPSWEGANCAATKETPSILWNPKVQYRFHKSTSLLRILSQFNPIHTIPSYICKIHFNIVRAPTQVQLTCCQKLGYNCCPKPNESSPHPQTLIL